MENPSQGRRTPEDEILFRIPTKDRAIVADRITPAIEGYFRLPAVWIGHEPDSDLVLRLNPPVHHHLVIERNLVAGIGTRVLLDGTFLFDFSSWSDAPQIKIPGYRQPDGPHRLPSESAAAEMKSEEYAVIRAQVMNVHQACLATSELRVKRRSAQMGFPVSPTCTLKGLGFIDSLCYRDSVSDTRAIMRNVLNNKDSVPRKSSFPRRVLEPEIIEHSLDLLDEILSKNDRELIQLIESSYFAACNCVEGRLGEAVTLAWGVCEQLLTLMWDELVSDRSDNNRMPSSRRARLVSRDYSASVISEILEITCRLDYQTYRLLDKARKSRNDWAHKMKEPSSSEVLAAIRGMERLFQQVKGVDISFQITLQGGGVPQWNIWIWEAYRNHLSTGGG